MTSRTDPPTVLAVDDDEEQLALFEVWLADDYRVLTATDGTAALERFDRSVDVVLLDRKMPGPSGDDVLDRLRARPGHCRVVMVTGEPVDGEAISLPFDDYLEKPISRADLDAAVERACDHANYGRLLDELYTVASRIAILEAHVDDVVLDANEDYRELRARFDDLQSEFRSVTEEFSDREFWAAFDRGVAPGD